MIGGVITSTLLTLLVIPTLYDILAEMRDRLTTLLTRRGPRVYATAVNADSHVTRTQATFANASRTRVKV